MTEQTDYSDKTCKNMCGFFGTESNDGYCSVCYKKHLENLEKNTEATIRGSNSNSSNRQTQSAECVLSNSNTASSFKSDNGSIIINSRVSPPSRKSSLSDVAIKKCQDILPQSPRAQEIPPMSALKSGSGIPGSQETFEISIDEEYDEESDNFLEANKRPMLLACHSVRAESNSECDTTGNSLVLDCENSLDNDESKMKPNRCGICNKKLGLTGFKCRCGGQYCSIHRYSDKHECSFDYKEYGQRQIRKNNPVVSGEKISKI